MGMVTLVTIPSFPFPLFVRGKEKEGKRSGKGQKELKFRNRQGNESGRFVDNDWRKLGCYHQLER
jgi:hypothetical protein